MKVLNVGSLNVDHVYRVDVIAQPGQTVAALDYRVFAGGKGANQSVALARAGACVHHAGKVGPESVWLKERLAREGVNVDGILVADSPGGHAVIQVDRHGQNSICVHGGANRLISDRDAEAALDVCQPGDWLLLQNETSATATLLAAGAAAGLTVCFNPAPMTDEIRHFPLGLVDLLILNEPEAAVLAGAAGDADQVLGALRRKFPDTRLVLTLGSAGAVCAVGTDVVRVAAPRVEAVDTTAAGDTFIGYLVAGLLEGMAMREALNLACRAAALSVTRAGALDSIPYRRDVDATRFPLGWL